MIQWKRCFAVLECLIWKRGKFLGNLTFLISNSIPIWFFSFLARRFLRLGGIFKSVYTEKGKLYVNFYFLVWMQLMVIIHTSQISNESPPYLGLVEKEDLKHW
jgi:hypothetical protein